MRWAPVLLTAYRRPEALESALRSLARCEGASSSSVLVASDGARRAEDASAVEEVRQLLRLPEWRRRFGDFRVLERDANVGRVANSQDLRLYARTTWSRFIYLEEDVETHQCFLTYMNESLDRYALIDDVVLVCAGFQGVAPKGERESFLDSRFTSYGFASWFWKWDRLVSADRSSLLQRFREDRDECKRYLTGSPSRRTTPMALRGEIQALDVQIDVALHQHGWLAVFPDRAMSRELPSSRDASHPRSRRRRSEEALSDDRSLSPPLKLEVTFLDACLRFDRLFILYAMAWRLKLRINRWTLAFPRAGLK